MRSGKYCLLIIVAGFIGCAGAETARIDDSRLLHLPAQAKNVVLDRQRDVNAAESNLDAMRAAAREAERFEKIVEQEHTAAAIRLAALRRSLELARTSHDQDMREDATNSRRIAGRRLAATGAKLEYARALEELRGAQVAAAEAELELAQANLERTKYQKLLANNMADGLERESFESAVVQAENRLREERQEEIRRRAEVNVLQQQWHGRWKQYRALAGPTRETTIDAPAPPESVDAERLGAVNR